MLFYTNGSLQYSGAFRNRESHGKEPVFIMTHSKKYMKVNGNLATQKVWQELLGL